MPPTDIPAGLPDVLVGGYTAGQAGHADGVTSLRWARSAAALVAVDTLELSSPSYLVTHPTEPWLFAVSEDAPAAVSSALLGDDGSVVLLSSVGAGGNGACHLALSPEGGRLLVANYGSGSVSSFTVGWDGRLSAMVDRITFSGSGPDPDRQEGPHAHQVVWDGEQVLVPDLGTDRLHRLQVAENGRLSEAGPAVQLPPGSGPRHLVVIGDHLVVACELSGRLWLAERGATGAWLEVASVPCSGVASEGPALPSALRADADQLFVANRGPGTVAVFTLDRAAGRLERIAEFGCGGAGPRDLALGPGQLWVANQADDVLSVFDRSSLPPTSSPRQVPSPTPTCVLLRAYRGAIT
jgi:6-phosphogluconolactonase